MNQLKIFKNELFEVGTKVEGDIILFDAEQVARSLGIVSKTTKNGVEYENVRWSRVNEFLPQVAEIQKGSLIPESFVYKLAFKASNEVAEKFQDWLAIEVIPTIRKHGAYMTPETIEKVLTDPDTIIQLATNLKEEMAKRMAAEALIERQKPQVLFAEAVQTSDTSILIGQLAKLITQNGVPIGQNRLFAWLRDEGYLGKKGAHYNEPTQYAVERGWFEVTERTLNNPDGSVRITRTTKVTGKGQVYFINKFLSHKKVI